MSRRKAFVDSDEVPKWMRGRPYNPQGKSWIEQYLLPTHHKGL
jgi:hypothetical protein